ncbi:MAG TPA: hypothetical protein VKM94_05125 [Blastocatellia bacterium]|nr:hypothetical protein [Blastocatellia bacterium]
MEREKEIEKLVNVLRRTSRMALQAEWTGSNPDVAAFCIDQYNRVLARLKELDPGVGSVFEPLASGSSLTVAAMACRQLAAYYEDEVGRQGGWGDWARSWGDPRFGLWADKKAFKEFWDKSAREFEDFGDFIRQSFEEWFSQRKEGKPPGEGKAEEAAGQTGKSEERKTSPIDPETR